MRKRRYNTNINNLGIAPKLEGEGEGGVPVDPKIGP